MVIGYAVSGVIRRAARTTVSINRSGSSRFEGRGALIVEPAAPFPVISGCSADYFRKAHIGIYRKVRTLKLAGQSLRLQTTPKLQRTRQSSSVPIVRKVDAMLALWIEIDQLETIV